MALLILQWASAPPAVAEGSGMGTKKEIPMVAKTVMGEVSAVNSNGIAVVTERNVLKAEEREIWFPLGPSVKLTGIEGLRRLQEGDLVEVAYLEAKDGSQRVATRVMFLSPKKPEPAPIAEEEAEEVAELKSIGGRR